jgi:hypothetical protein
MSRTQSFVWEYRFQRRMGHSRITSAVLALRHALTPTPF